jgi:hypothetical protein
MFEVVLVPARVGLLSIDDESRVCSNPMPQRFIDPQRRLNIDDPDQEAVLIEVSEFPKPVQEAVVFLYHIRRILTHILLMVFFGKVSLIKEDLTVTAMAESGEHTGNNLQGNRFHFFSLRRIDLMVTQGHIRFNSGPFHFTRRRASVIQGRA